ncbi:MAG TPA: L-2-amino-thiazoline-4-carboxylic acid hydrolase [Bacillaceae bacterium]
MSKPVPSDQSLEPVSMFAITAKLYKHVSDSVNEAFGEQGDTLVAQGIQAVTEEQVRDIRSASGELGADALFTHDRLAGEEIIEQTFELYSAARKQAGLEEINMYGMMAKIFAQISKAVVDQYGEEGQQAIMRGVGTFGEERGRDIARRAAVRKEPNDKDHYLSNYDMGRSDLFEYETLFHPTEIEQTFTRCAFAEQWKKDGMGEYGILYCHMIDPSIARGFNPKFEVVHDQYILKEGTCHFRFQLKEDEEDQSAQEK